MWSAGPRTFVGLAALVAAPLACTPAKAVSAMPGAPAQPAAARGAPQPPGSQGQRPPAEAPEEPLARFDTWLGAGRRACGGPLRTLAKELGLSHLDAEIEPGRATVSWLNGAADCDADAFSIQIERRPGAVAPWREGSTDDALQASRRTRELAVEVTAGTAVAGDRDLASRFRARAMDIVDQCLE